MTLIEKSIKGVYTRKNEGGILTEHKIRPSGWQPGANTIAYWKLETNGNDETNNHYNLTLNGITFNQTGSLKYAKVTTANQNCYQPGVFTQANVGTGDFCVSMRFYPVDPGTRVPILFLDSPDVYSLGYPGVNIFFDPNKVGFGSLDAIYFRLSINKHAGSSVTASSLYNGWHHILFTRLNGTCYAYIDGQSVITPYNDGTNISQLGQYTAYIIGGNGTTQSRGNTGARFSQIICEKVGWSAQEVLDYYNGTKSIYGL